jgi:hypothetical protein
VKELPDDLAALDAADLASQITRREELIAPLFRRWPKLSHVETRQLRRLYTERVRIAKYLGKLRAAAVTPDKRAGRHEPGRALGARELDPARDKRL